MSKLTTAQRKNMPKSSFAIPSKAPGPGSYPLNNTNHAGNALARSSGKPVAGQVRAAVKKKFPNMGSSKNSGAVGYMMSKKVA